MTTEQHIQRYALLQHELVVVFHLTTIVITNKTGIN